MTVEVIVVGAGPAGSAAAIELARRGRRVTLMDSARFPRDKACGDGLTAASLHQLQALGLDLGTLPAHLIGGVEVTPRSGRRRDFQFHAAKSGIVVRRVDFDHWLARSAVAAGAIPLEGARVTEVLRAGSRVCGVRFRDRDSERELRADYVVLAVGTAERLLRSAGRAPDPAASGIAMRQYFAVDRMECAARLQVYAPLADPNDGKSLCGYGWVFPLSPGVVNVGIGYFGAGQRPTASMKDVLAAFVDTLRKERRFGRMTAHGALSAGRLACGVESNRVHGPGVALIGDAAGLVDPFTGEGINSALESGRVAARCIDEVLAGVEEDPDLSTYGRWIEHRFAGRFRLGERHVRAYGFLWHVLEHTFDQDHPVFDALRRTALDYGGEGSALLPRESHELLEAIRERLQRYNDMGAGLVERLFDAKGASRRLAIMAEAAGRGGCGSSKVLDVATALEMAVMAHLVHDGVRDEPPGHADAVSVDWANKFTLMFGARLIVECLVSLADKDDRLMTAFSRAGQEISAQTTRGGPVQTRFDTLAAELGAILA